MSKCKCKVVSKGRIIHQSYCPYSDPYTEPEVEYVFIKKVDGIEVARVTSSLPEVIEQSMDKVVESE